MIKGMWSPDDRVCVILIPKNAHLSIKYSLGDSQFKRKSVENIEGVTYIAVLRHSLSRWITGFATYLSNRVESGTLSEQIAFDFIESSKDVFKIIEFDIHTTPQYKFISPLKEVKLFQIENLDAILPFIEKYGVNSIDRHHVTEEFDHNSFHYKVFCKINEFMKENKEYCDIINDYYQKDLDLYNSLKGTD